MMTSYEILAVVVSCIAAIVSLVVWRGQRKLQKESNDLQRAVSELAKKQLEILLQEEKGKQQARLSLKLFRDGKSYRIQLTNVSEVEAQDVHMELLLDDLDDSPLVASEYDRKFPIKKLSPDSSVTLIAAPHKRSPPAYTALLKWTNPDGSVSEDETFVAL
jgi:hypothetical protein